MIKFSTFSIQKIFNVVFHNPAKCRKVEFLNTFQKLLTYLKEPKRKASPCSKERDESYSNYPFICKFACLNFVMRGNTLQSPLH